MNEKSATADLVRVLVAQGFVLVGDAPFFSSRPTAADCAARRTVTMVTLEGRGQTEPARRYACEGLVFRSTYKRVYAGATNDDWPEDPAEWPEAAASEPEIPRRLGRISWHCATARKDADNGWSTR